MTQQDGRGDDSELCWIAYGETEPAPGLDYKCERDSLYSKSGVSGLASTGAREGLLMSKLLEA